MFQVIANLLGNAIKFTAPGGVVSLTVSPSDREVLVQVIDTGPGIAEDRLSHIFDRYWRPKDSSKGAGLGLFIAKGIVEAHGGIIWAESQEGIGSNFQFTIRRAEEGAVSQTRASSITDKSHKPIVLVVDDEEDIRDTLRDIIESRGYRAVTVANGAEALAYLRHSERPRLILLDSNMPVMNGRQFVAESRRYEWSAGIPLIVISADRHAHEWTSRANVDLLTKPLPIDTLVQALNQRLG